MEPLQAKGITHQHTTVASSTDAVAKAQLAHYSSIVAIIPATMTKHAFARKYSAAGVQCRRHHTQQ